MTNAFGSTVTALATILAVVLATILPTSLYLYVEPRGRPSWGGALEPPHIRRAPAIVRVTAWLSFAIGQLAFPWIVAVPAACVALVYLQAKLGAGRPLGIAFTVVLGGMALAQSLLAMRLLPLGVRLLARDARSRKRLEGVARTNGFASALLFSAGALLGSAMTAVPWLVHPWLRVALTSAALRPIMGYAVVGLLHALLLGLCVRALADDPPR